MLNKNKIDHAIELINIALKKTPDSSELLNQKAKLIIQRGNINEGKRILLKILKQSPENIEALINLGILELQEKNIQHAVEFFKNVLILDPNNKTAILNLSEISNKSTSNRIKKFDINQLIPSHETISLKFFNDIIDQNIMPLKDLIPLCKIVKNKKPEVIFEFGTYQGTTTLHLSANTQAIIYTFDLPPKGHEHYLRPENTDENLDVYPQKPGSIFHDTPYADTIHQVFGDSKSYDFSNFYNKVDIVFVDACHHFEYVLQDSLNAFKIVKSDGIIIWHDYASYAPGVMKALEELNAKFPLFHIQNTNLVVFYGKKQHFISESINLCSSDTMSNANIINPKFLKKTEKTNLIHNTINFSLHNLYLYVGHHKCATTWINKIIDNICSNLNLNFFNAHNRDMLKNMSIDKIDFFADTGIQIMEMDILDQVNYKGFHVIRDPRDIIVSSYFSHLKTHINGDWLKDHRKNLNNVNLNDGIKLEIDFISGSIIKMMEWNYKNPNIYETRFEILTADPLNEFINIFQFLDIYPNFLPINILSQIINANSFERMSNGRIVGQEDTNSHYRKGIHGDWINYFTEANKKYFKEKLGHVLIKLGYEKDFDW